MRQIKFRAWNKPTKQMIYWGFFRDVFHKGGADYRNFEPEYNEWMQFTGLKDKNGKEIYEGDILACPPLFEGDRPLFTVEWGKHDYTRMFGWMQKNATTGIGALDDSIIENGEIIGNIHENPELLEIK